MEENCPKCDQPWDDHEFSVPEPFCPPKKLQASDCTCRECGEPAVAFFPVVDPDIPSYPYCRKCLEKARFSLLLAIEKEMAKSRSIRRPKP